MDAPLEGIRVLDLTRVVAGPIVGRILADLGADVIKVESPDLDVTRAVQPILDGQSAYGTHMNAGKRGIVVDLERHGAADLLARLAEHCDVLLENFRPGVLERFALGPDDLAARHPGLIYCSVTGWGRGNAWSQRRAYAPLVHAEVGTIEMAARLRGGAPLQEVHVHGDLYAGMFATQAILAALFQRERTGRGQHLDVSMAGALVYANDWAPVEWQRYEGARQFDIWTHPVLALGDGTLVALVGNPVTAFHGFVQAFGGDPALLHDSRFTPRAQMECHLDEAVAILAELVRGFESFAAIEGALDGLPLMVAEVRSVEALRTTAWADEVGLVAEVEPGLPIARAPWRSSSADIGVRGPAPRAGQHNREVLAGVLGMTEAEIDDLARVGVIATPQALGGVGALLSANARESGGR